MSNIAFITTFGNVHWDIYAKVMLESFVKYMPKDIPLMVQLDDDLLHDQVDKILPPECGIFVGWTDEHKAFVERNKGKDHPTDYRKQAVKFCHKVFCIQHSLDAIQKARTANAPDIPRYLIWVDADVHITKPITLEDIQKCLPKEGDAVAYLGRKDWDHSECGWLAFDLENGGDRLITNVYQEYVDDHLFGYDQWHDSYIWDQNIFKGTNLTQDKPGMEIWPQSPMASWSIHYKGPEAKQKLFQQPKQQLMKPPAGQNFVIQTKNAIPHEEICRHIKENQRLISNWLVECLPNKEEIVIASAGPLLIPEDLRSEVKAGRKIVAVKHALSPLKKAGIKPWACILLDPRPHVADFVKEADPDVLWFVASQVNPEVTQVLLERGCEVWGYHASVGADEQELTRKQPSSIVNGGSATATRGLFLLSHLGFRNFRLYGYELAYPDKPDMNAKDELGQPKFMEFSLGAKSGFIDYKRQFYSEPQLIAQFEELNQIVNNSKFNIQAFGEGMIPFIVRMKKLGELRENELKCKIVGKTRSYKRLFGWNKTRKTSRSRKWGRILLPTRRRPMAKNKLLSD